LGKTRGVESALSEWGGPGHFLDVEIWESSANS
jgi:hypothetical protein